jgi:hypothetical protein
VTEKPLHVRVAEALGCKPVTDADDPGGLRGWACVCGSADKPHPWGKGPHSDTSPSHTLARYDTDWSATGPLIERLGITVNRHHRRADWSAHAGEGPETDGSTALVAVCNLILSLAAAGKLKAA